MAESKDVFIRHYRMFIFAGVNFSGDIGLFWSIVVKLQRYLTLFFLLYIHCFGLTLGVVFYHSKYELVPTLVMACGIFSGPSNLCKHLMLHRRRKQIKELMDQLNRNKSKQGLGTFEKFLMYSYEGMAFFFTGASFLKNAVEIPDLTVPYPVWEPFEVNTQGRRTYHFFAVYYSIFMAWMVMAFVDTMLLIMSSQLCHKLAVLKHTFQMIGLTEAEKVGILKKKEVLPLDDNKDSTIMKAALDEHFQLMKITKSLSDILNEVFIYQIITSMPVLLVCLYIFSNSEEWVNDALAFSGALVVVFIQVLTTCWSGELIKTRFEQIHFAVYNNQWYKVDLKIKSSLLLVATYSIKPVILRGAYVFNLSLQTYETFIRQAFSLLAVMYQFLD